MFPNISLNFKKCTDMLNEIQNLAYIEVKNISINFIF